MSRSLASVVAFSFSLVACGEVPYTPGTSDQPDAAAAPDIGSDANAIGAFELSSETIALSVVTGSTSSLDIKITRHEPFTGAVTLTLAGLPSGVTAAPITVEADQTTATFELSADDSALHTLPTQVVVNGSAGSLEATLTTTLTVQGPPGSLDQSFMAGKQLLPVGAGADYGYATAVQPDGKILVAGFATENNNDFALVRLERDGTLDTTFGNGGKVLTDFNGGSDVAYAIALQPDGKIVVAGSAAATGALSVFAVARYNANGTLDTTFSGDGKQTTAFTNHIDVARAVVVQPDGKIVVGGQKYASGFPIRIEFALVRYLADGSLDTSFGGTGMVFTAAKPGMSWINALALQQVGNELCIVAAGGDGDFVLARYRPNGQLDPTFGTSGLVSGVFQSSTGIARAITVAPSGTLFVAGSINRDIAVAELSSAGVVTSGFGRRTVAVNASNTDEAQAIVLDNDRPIVAGWAYEGASDAGNFVLVRFAPDGSVDTSFGGGIVTTPLGAAGKPDQAHAIALQVDSRVPTVRAVVAGYAMDQTVDFAVARYWR